MSMIRSHRLEFNLETGLPFYIEIQELGLVFQCGLQISLNTGVWQTQKNIQQEQGKQVGRNP